MNRKLLFAAFTIINCICGTSVYSQWQSGLWTEKQAYNWFYGTHEGLNFETSPPTPVPGQVQPAFPGALGSGAGAMSDSNGNLLFYSHGITVWDKNHTIMDNGTGLYGDANAMQSGLIVPIPGQAQKYLVFSIDSPIVGSHGLSYSEVDMSLNSGLGAVTANKNIQLAAVVTSKISATYNEDGTAIWVLCHLLDGNEFAAFEVTSSGISATPVISAVGESYQLALQDETGQLKFSPDGNLVGFANPYVTRKLQLFNFNKETGVLSEPFFTMDAEFTGGLILGPYGLEFSPNSKLLYVTEGDDYIGFGSSRLHQFNLEAGDAVAIKNSDVILKEYNWTGDGNYLEFMIMGGMQLTPEGKIYMRPFFNGSDGYVNAINYPNNVGMAAQYQEAAVGVPEGTDTNAFITGWFPGFVQSYFESGILSTEVDCDNEAAFSLLRIPGITSVAWNFGDTESGVANTSTLLNPGHIFSGPGTYTITAQITSNEAVQIATTQIIVEEGISIGIPVDISQCAQSNNETFDLAAQEQVILNGQTSSELVVTYHISNEDAQTGDNAISEPETFISSGQTIFVRLANSFTGCFKTTTFKLILLPLPVLTEDFELEACGSFDLTGFGSVTGEGISLAYYIDEDDAIAGINSISNPEEYSFEGETGFIYARGTNTAGCFSIAQFTIKQANCSVQKGISPNNDGINDFFDLEFFADKYGIGSLEIFNRYGKKVYQRSDYANQWYGQDSDGKELPTGTYYYVVKLKNSHPEYGMNMSSWIYIQRQE